MRLQGRLTEGAKVESYGFNPETETWMRTWTDSEGKPQADSLPKGASPDCDCEGCLIKYEGQEV